MLHDIVFRSKLVLVGSYLKFIISFLRLHVTYITCVIFASNIGNVLILFQFSEPLSMTRSRNKKSLSDLTYKHRLVSLLINTIPTLSKSDDLIAESEDEVGWKIQNTNKAYYLSKIAT